MLRSDSPPAEWYEPRDLVDDDEPEPEPIAAEILTVNRGVVWWTGTSVGDEA